MAVVPRAGFQPEMVPSSVENRKSPGLPGATRKVPVPLKTVPVGAAGGVPPAGGGMVTTSGLATGNNWPAPLYRVEVPVALLATHNGLVALAEMPHGFTRFGSVCAARPGMSETRLAWT
jgi:hypothetical protein